MERPTLGVADVIRTFKAALVAARGESVTPAQQRVLRDLAACRTRQLGGHVYECEACGVVHNVYNSCRNRHCPSCLAHRAADWLEARREELLPVEYFHVVFTVPEPVAELALGNKRVIYEILFATSAETLQTIARDPRHLGANIGFLSVLHTWSQTLIHHPHVHCVIPGGGLSADGERWVPTRPGFFLPVRVLSRLFRGKFTALLEKARAAAKLAFAGATADLATDKGWRRFLRKIRKKDWVVYAKRPFGSPELVLKYLARYTHRVAISNRRIVAIENGRVSFRYRDSAHENQTRTMSLEGTEFLRRFLLHVVPKGFTRVRHFGFLANCVRKSKLAKCRALLGTAAVPLPGLHDDEDVTLDQVEAQGGGTAEPPRSLRLCPTCGVGLLVLIATLAPSWEREEEVTTPDTS
jgi:hypothetical protein